MDNRATERWPIKEADLWFPVHQVAVTKYGVYKLENLDTSELARDKAYEFAFIFAPLNF